LSGIMKRKDEKYEAIFHCTRLMSRIDGVSILYHQKGVGLEGRHVEEEWFGTRLEG